MPRPGQAGTQATEELKARDARLSAVSVDLSAAREAEAQARQQVAELNTAVAAAAAELAQQKQELGMAAQQYGMLLARVTALEPFRAALVDQVRASIGDQPGVVLTPDSIVLESDGMFNQRRSVITLTDEGEAQAPCRSRGAGRRGVPDPGRLPLGAAGRGPYRRPAAEAGLGLPHQLAARGRAGDGGDGVPARLRLPGDRLTTASYAQYQPLDTGGTAESRKHNRRIELRLDER